MFCSTCTPAVPEPSDGFTPDATLVATSVGLEPIATLRADETAALAKRFVAAQPYFVDAHVIVLPTSRFRRTFWKYRDHAKAYRALILDVGHLSQAL